MVPKFTYNKLKGRIIEVLESNGRFIELMQWSRPTFQRKLNGESEWTQNEIWLACHFLNIDLANVAIYFFDEIVQD